MKSNFNKSKRWAPKASSKRRLLEERPTKSQNEKPAKPLNIAKILEIQKRIKKEKE